uniref:Uncharacterized protein n=2 Tax=Oryza barthii TaxID=65489 RepID=A0A0D3GR78_9ORYZ
MERFCAVTAVARLGALMRPAPSTHGKSAHPQQNETPDKENDASTVTQPSPRTNISTMPLTPVTAVARLGALMRPAPSTHGKSAHPQQNETPDKENDASAVTQPSPRTNIGMQGLFSRTASPFQDIIVGKHSQKQCVFPKWSVTRLGSFSNLILFYNKTC